MVCGVQVQIRRNIDVAPVWQIGGMNLRRKPELGRCRCAEGSTGVWIMVCTANHLCGILDCIVRKARKSVDLDADYGLPRRRAIEG